MEPTSRPSTALPASPTRSGDEAKLARSFYKEPGGTVSRDLSLKDLSACVRDGRGPLWVDIDTSVRQQLALLEKVFGFHPLAIEDVMNPSGRAKVEAYDGYLFVVLRAVQLDEQTTDPYDLETENIHFFISQNVLVTAHHGPSRLVDSRGGTGASELATCWRAGPGRLAHQVMDAAVDSFFPVLDRIDDFIDSLEERVFQQFREEALRDIFAVKRMVLSLRRYLAPEREIFNVLTNRPSPFLVDRHPALLPGHLRSRAAHQRLARHVSRPAEQHDGELPVAGLEPARPGHQGAVGGGDALGALRGGQRDVGHELRRRSRWPTTRTAS